MVLLMVFLFVYGVLLLTFDNGFLSVKVILSNWSTTPIHYGSFDLFGPSGEFGTSGPMGFAHGTQKC